MSEIIKVEEDSPWRCQAVNKDGQCRNKAEVEGGNCICHGGATQRNALEKKSIRLYQLSKFKNRLERHADAPKLKSLNEEVAILRMMLEERLNQCKDEFDLMTASHAISDLVIKIEKLVRSCHKLEASLGGLMDKQALMTFATQIIDVISDEIEDADKLGRIANGITSVVDKLETSMDMNMGSL